MTHFFECFGEKLFWGGIQTPECHRPRGFMAYGPIWFLGTGYNSGDKFRSHGYKQRARPLDGDLLERKPWILGGEVTVASFFSWAKGCSVSVRLYAGSYLMRRSSHFITADHERHRDITPGFQSVVGDRVPLPSKQRLTDVSVPTGTKGGSISCEVYKEERIDSSSTVPSTFAASRQADHMRTALEGQVAAWQERWSLSMKALQVPPSLLFVCLHVCACLWRFYIPNI